MTDRTFKMEGADNCVQSNLAINPEPGNYYVSCVKGTQFRLLLGPFTYHATALARVQEVNNFACERDHQAHWYAFGTLSLEPGDVRPGVLNQELHYTREP